MGAEGANRIAAGETLRYKGQSGTDIYGHYPLFIFFRSITVVASRIHPPVLTRFSLADHDLSSFNFKTINF